MLTLKFDHRLQELLPRRYRSHRNVHYPLDRRASIKDIVESLHIPHTEIGSIEREGEELSFKYIPKDRELLELCSFPAGIDVTRPTLLRPEPLSAPVFMVDVNVGKLARLLRMAGIDTWYDPELAEAELARQAAAHDRILLSRNRDLLRRKIITWGHLVRAEQPEDQLVEIIILYGLQGVLEPFSRCLECNTPLRPVDKSAILHQLEPLTRRYYHQFKRCPDCGRIYWRGSHHQHMQELMTGIQDFQDG
ncbi:MAG TPA: hypothetical protein ENK84_01975 [Desulfobulbus sp.]|nr:hypothetical protein [Desulfobulbus sp.]